MAAACSPDGGLAGTTATPATVDTAPTTTTIADPTTASAPPRFEGGIELVDAKRLSHSWTDGCPVPPGELRLVKVTHRGFDGAVHRGELIVHHTHADEVLSVFRSLFSAGFPIEEMRPVGDFDESRLGSPGQNNTSGFNCRFIEGTTTWSEHAKGLAIDLNPQQNPFIDGTVIDPPEAERYVDRTLKDPGMIQPDDLVIRAFESIGWLWGGDWTSKKDYHHFSATGR